MTAHKAGCGSSGMGHISVHIIDAQFRPDNIISKILSISSSQSHQIMVESQGQMAVGLAVANCAQTGN